jgi:putative ABC transport system permease protein
MFRREWRQQLLVVALVAVTVAAAVVGISAADNTPRPSSAKFGSARQLIRIDGTDARALRATVSDAQRSFGTIDVIGRGFEAIPGSVKSVEYRAQSPHGHYGRPLLALRDGRYPTDMREAAVTDGVAETLRLRVGSTLGPRRPSPNRRRHRREPH